MNTDDEGEQMIGVRRVLLTGVLLTASPAFAKAPPEPCHTRSRQMTLVKNCYTGEMMKASEGSAQFFSSIDSKTKGPNYCFNSLVMIEHKNGEAKIHLHVMRDSKDGKFHSYYYALTPTEITATKKQPSTVLLQGLTGECFAGDPEACAGGILKTIGLTNTDLPMVVGIGRTNAGAYTVSHLVQTRGEIEAIKSKELELKSETNAGVVTDRLLQEIRKKIMTVAHTKLSAMHSGASPKKLADASEQFRYCSMALEGFLKDKKMPEPFTTEEKAALTALTNYMNGDAHVNIATASQEKASNRTPASPGSSATAHTRKH